MNTHTVSQWTNRELFEAIECHTADEMAAQTELANRDRLGTGLTGAEAAKYRAEMLAQFADMDEMAEACHV